MNGIKSRMRGLRAPILMCVYFAIVLGIFSLFYSALGGSGSYYGSSYSRPVPQGSDLAASLYTVLVVLVFGVIVLMSPAMCAGAIAGERERQTLDLLLCSPLSARRIVTGKMLSNLAFILFLLMLTLPLFAMVYLFGGSSFGDIVVLFLYLAICAYACTSVAIFFSALLKRSSLATILTYVALFLFVVLTFVGGAYAMQLHNMNYTGAYPDPYVPLLWRINPVYAVVEILTGTSTTAAFSSLLYGGYGYSYAASSGVFANASSLLVSSLFMFLLSLLLNLASAVAIKPVKKLGL